MTRLAVQEIKSLNAMGAPFLARFLREKWGFLIPRIKIQLSNPKVKNLKSEV